MNLSLGEVLGIVIVAVVAGGLAWEFLRKKAPAVATAVDEAAGMPKSDGQTPKQQD